MTTKQTKKQNKPQCTIEVPTTTASFYNAQHRAIYEEIMQYDTCQLNEQQRDFRRNMYLEEEYIAYGEV